MTLLSRILFYALLILIYSCTNSDLSSDESPNAPTTYEVGSYKGTSADLLKEIISANENQDYLEVKRLFDEMKHLFPETQEFEEVQKLYDEIKWQSAKDKILDEEKKITSNSKKFEVGYYSGTPEELLEEIKTANSNQYYLEVKQLFSEMENSYPEAPEYKEAKKIYDNVINQSPRDYQQNPIEQKDKKGYLKKHAGKYSMKMKDISDLGGSETYLLKSDGYAKWTWIMNGRKMDEKVGTWSASSDVITISIPGNSGMIVENYILRKGLWEFELSSDRYIVRQ